MMQTGICSVTFRNKTAEEVIKLVKEAKLSGIEWGGDIHVPHGNLDEARRISLLTTAAGLKVLSYGSYYNADSGDNRQEVIDTACALGAPLIRVWIGTKSSKNTAEEEFLKIVNDLKEFCALAKDKSILVAGEFHKNTYNDNAECALKLLNAVNAENLKTLWQPTTFDNRDIDILTALKPHLAALHVFKWNKVGKRYPLKKGENEWRQYFKLCEGLNINALLEFVKKDSEKQFLKDAATLSEVIV